MIWPAGWAWLGLAAIAIPIAVHLIGRRRPVHLRFPTLQFVPPGKLLPSRRRRLHDVPLLAVRIGIIAIAVAALAGPQFSTGPRRAADTSLARAIVIDTSPSMSRLTPGGAAAVDDARARARVRADAVPIARLIETASLAHGLASAVTWLASQPLRREVVVVSDFQSGAIDAADIGVVPADTGVRLERIAVVDAPRDVAAGAVRTAAATLAATLRLDDQATTVTWTAAQPSSSSEPPVAISAGEAEQAQQDAVVAAALAQGVPVGPPTRSVRVVFPNSPDRARVLAESLPPNQPWMSALGSGLALQHRQPGFTGNLQFRMLPPATLVVLTDSDVASPAAARLLAGLTTAVVERTPTTELEPVALDDDVLRGWSREPGAAAPRALESDDSTDGRWLWGVVILLLIGEWLMRRRPAAGSASQPSPLLPYFDRPPPGEHDARVA